MAAAAAATSSPSSKAATAAFRIGMFGGGVVGGGVYELVQKVNQQQRAGGNCRIEIVKICVRSVDKPRDFAVDESVTAFTTDPNDILQDKTLDCVVEVMGGTGLAKTAVEAALTEHKAVATANKALLAQHLDELNRLSVVHTAPLAYEAAVCGGIPIVHVLQSSYSGDSVRSVLGICNGTTNYMLGKMEAGYDYSQALREAQELGYAEADPTADVEGHDVAAKICLLAKLAFGTTVPVDAVPCKGISSIGSLDFRYGSELNCTIKLLGSAALSSTEDDGKVSAYVTPTMVPLSHVLASARGSGNAVLVDSRNMGTCAYTGPGAGRYPTANSVVADIVRLANDGSSGTADAPRQPPFPLQTSYALDTDYEGSFYVRCRRSEEGGSSSAAEASAAKLGIELVRKESGFVVTADGCKLSQVQSLAKEVQSPMFMPILKS